MSDRGHTAPPPARKAASLEDALRGLSREQSDLDFVPRVVDHLVFGPPARRRRRRFAPLLFGFAGAGGTAALLLSVFVNDGSVAPQPGGATAAIPDDGAPHAVVIGSDPLRVDAGGSVRLLFFGDPVPLGQALRPEPGRTAALRVGDRADVVLDAGAIVAVELPSNSADAIRLVEGRITAEVRSARRPFRVRIDGVPSEIWSEQGGFSVLAAGGERWATAVSTGMVRVEGDGQSVWAGPDRLVGGGPDVSVTVRPIPDELVLETRAQRTGTRWVVEGLTDLLARVEASDRTVAVDAGGRFRFQPEGQASVRIIALDAVGRRVERAAEPRTSSPPSSRRPVAEPLRKRAQGSPRPITPENEDEILKVGPPDW